MLSVDFTVIQQFILVESIMNWRFLLSSAMICCLLEGIDTANILVVAPMPSHSHFKSFQPLWEALVERDHNLTIIAGHKLNDEFQLNYTLIDVKHLFVKLKIEFEETRKLSRIHNLISLSNALQDYIDEVLQSSNVQHVINSKMHYDLVIAELCFSDAILAFGYKFDAPVITFTPFSLVSFYNWILSNPFSPSYIPDLFLPLTEKMSLLGRMENMIFSFISVLFYEFVSLPRSQTQVEKYFHFEKENVPRVKDIVKNISVALVSSHYSFGYVKPELPNVVNVAGLHFTTPTLLPKEVQKFMDEAENGVIYLSLGSVIKPDKVEDFGKIFVREMESLPQRVVMKWDPQLLNYIPNNFLVQKWFAQVDVLNHPKCRLFITHGGLHSLLESLNATVPLIGIPFFNDQHHNMATVEYYEIGTTLEIDDISTDLQSKINEVLHNPKYLIGLNFRPECKTFLKFLEIPKEKCPEKWYKENIIKRSLLFRERHTNPLETALYWVDHVLKHKNTAHLKPGSAHLTWYQLYSLDLLVILAVAIWIIVIMFKFLIRPLIKQSAISMKNYLFPARKSWQKDKLVDGLKSD